MSVPPAGLQRAQPFAGVRGVPEKLLLLLLARRRRRRARRKKKVGHSPTPQVKGRALDNPP